MIRHRKQGINRNRCDECRKRNKRCDLDPGDERCKVCLKKGIECKVREFQPIHYKTPKKILKPRIQAAQTQPTQQASMVRCSDSESSTIIQETINEVIGSDGDDTVGVKSEGENLLIKRNIILQYLNFTCKEGGLKTIRSTAFLGIYEKRISISSLVQGNILEETTVEVPLINTNTNFESRTNRKFGFNGDVQQYFKKVPEYVENTTLDPSVSLFLKYSYAKGSSEFSKDSPTASLKNIDDTSLKNEIFLEMPTLILGSIHDPKDNKIEGVFVNLPKYIPISEIEHLLNHFCINFASNTNRLLYATNDCSDYTQELLGVYLSLAFSNVLVLKALFLWSIHHQAPTKTCSFVEELETEIIHNVNHRIEYISAACCDHTLATLFLLVETQSLKVQGDSRFWPAVNRLLIKAISLRGGFMKLSESHNGRFFCRMFRSSYFTKFTPNLASDQIGLPFIENIEWLSMLPFVESPSRSYLSILELCSIMGKTLHLYHLMTLAKNANDLNRGGQDSRYTLLNDTNILDILDEGQQLETKAKELKISQDSQLFDIAIFIREATVLLIYQLIFNQTSTSGKTLLQIKRTMPLLNSLWEGYKSDSRSLLLILPLFVVGNDIHDSYHRIQFMDNLEQVSELTRDPKLQSIKMLLEECWNRNKDGNTWVPWPELGEEMKLILPIYSSI